MVLRFFMLAGILFFMSCSNVERSNPDDPGGNAYRGNQDVSSTSVERSSSSVWVSSSSVVVSSSSSVASSSSNVSSSSVTLSSSTMVSSSSRISSSSITSSSSTAVSNNLFAGGTGTKTDPYQISTAQQLQNLNSYLGSKSENKYFILNNDIDLTSYLCEKCNNGSPGNGYNSGAGWQPIGANSSNTIFQGKFNGNGYKVSGLWINRPDGTTYAGLFGSIESAEIINIGVVIDNNKGGIKGQVYTGSLVGQIYDNSTISNSYATGNVFGGNQCTGGLVGGVISTGTINNSYATGDVSGEHYIGGLIGCGSKAIINNSHATGNVSVEHGSNCGGGLIGKSSGTISGSYATGNVTGFSFLGGLIACLDKGGTISNSYATGSVTGNSSWIGGLVGRLSEGASISNSYATGSVTGNDYLTNGGLVGKLEDGAAISNSYYDKETTGRIDTGKGEGKTTDQMKTQSTYVGWDFSNIWEISSSNNNGYPTLR